MLSLLISIILTLTAFLMIIFAILKSKVDDDRKKRKGLNVSPIKTTIITSPNLDDIINNNIKIENIPNNGNLIERFNNAEETLIDNNNEYNNNNNNEYNNNEYNNNLENIDNEVYNDFDDIEGKWGIHEDQFLQLQNIEYYDEDDDDQNVSIAVDTFFNLNMKIYNDMNSKKSITFQKVNNIEESNKLKKDIEKINNNTKQIIENLDREKITKIQFMKMKSEEERKAFLRELEKIEENKRNREKSIIELTGKIKKVMGPSSNINEIKDDDESAMTLNQLDCKHVEALYEEGQNIMRDEVSHDFKDLFDNYSKFYRKIEKLLSRLREIHKVLQNKSVKSFEDSDVGMKEELLNLFEENKILIKTRLLKEPLIDDFIKLLCAGVMSKLKVFWKSIEDNSGKKFDELNPDNNYQLDDSMSKKLLRTLSAQFDEEMKEEVQQIFEKHKMFMVSLEKYPLVLVFEKLLMNQQTGLHIESEKIRIIVPEDVNNKIEAVGRDIKGFVTNIKSANGNGEKKIIFDTVLKIKLLLEGVAQFFSNEPLGYTKVLLILLEFIIGAVKECNDFEEIPVFTFIIYGIFRSMDNAHTRKESKRVLELFKFHSDLIGKAYLSEEAKTPNLLEFNISNDRKKQNENVAVFYGLLVASNSQFPLSINDGYYYIVTCGKALSRYIKHSSSDDSIKIENSKHYFTALTISLRTFGKALKIQVPQYKELLDTIERSAKDLFNLDQTEEGKALISAINLVKTGKSSTCKFINYKNQEPVVMKKNLVIFEWNSEKIVDNANKFASASNEKGAAFKEVQKVTGKLTGIFNKFNAIEDVYKSDGIRSKIINEVLGVDVIKNESVFQDYAYNSIVNNIFKKNESQQFTTGPDEPRNAFRYALLIKSLCGNHKVNMIFKSYFYQKCLLTIPDYSDEYIDQRDNEASTASYKVVSVYAVIIAYCEFPFNISEGWNLLAAIINHYSDPNINTIPNYVVYVLDILIGIAGESLYKKYQNRFIKYIELLQKVVRDKKLTSDKQVKADALNEKINKLLNKKNGKIEPIFKHLYYDDKHDLEELIRHFNK